MDRFRKFLLIGLTVALILGLGQTAMAAKFTFSTTGDVIGMDPHSNNEGPTNAMKSNIYEALLLRSWDLSVQPSLAVKWEQPNPTTWRFHLRKGVKFHEGQDFTADDVVFSVGRISAKTADMSAYMTSVKEAKKIDDYTVDIITNGPDPILNQKLTLVFIMDKEWCEKNKCPLPVLGSTQEIYATRHTNGTGPFMLKTRVPDTRTVIVPNPKWWGKVEHNITECTFVPIANPATRVSALLTKEVDMMFPVPLQDIARVNAAAGFKVIQGPELRTIHLGFDQYRDELLDMPGSGKNPFKDIRVRRAFYQAIDIKAIAKKIMRGAATPSGLMFAPGIVGWDEELNKRYPYDPEGAKKLLAEAGYPDGFPLTFDCPNDRYVNDEAISQAIVPMLSRIGIKVKLNSQTKGLHFDKIGRKQGNNTSFFMLGWTPGTYDGLNPLEHLMTMKGKGRGTWNCGRYSNPKVEELTSKIATETDQKKRTEMLHEAHRIAKEEFSHIPLHQQALAWGVRDGIELKQPANDAVYVRYIKVLK